MFINVLILFSMLLAHDSKYCGFDEVLEQKEIAYPGFNSNTNYIIDLAKKYALENGTRAVSYTHLRAHET